MRKIIALFTFVVTIIVACSPTAKGEVTIYVVAPLSGWQANGG
jgi:uncharacterized protein YfaP (DUF2135 family)